MDTSTFTARAMRILSGNIRSLSKCEISRIAYDLITQTKLRRIAKKAGVTPLLNAELSTTDTKGITLAQSSLNETNQQCG